MIKPKIKDSPINNDTKEERQRGDSLFTAPFKGFYELFSPLLPSFSSNSKTKEEKLSPNAKRDRQHLVAMLKAVDDVDKVYNVFMKVNNLP